MLPRMAAANSAQKLRCPWEANAPAASNSVVLMKGTAALSSRSVTATSRQTSSGLAWNIICIRSCIISSSHQPGYICRRSSLFAFSSFSNLLIIRRLSRQEVAGQLMHVYFQGAGKLTPLLSVVSRGVSLPAPFVLNAVFAGMVYNRLSYYT